MTPAAIERYARHLVLKEIGGPGQQALLGARIALVGAGGLGGPAGLYLAAAGVGRITLIDDDVIDLSNLQRQVQFTSADIGRDKVSIMANVLTALNPDCRVAAKKTRLNDKNASALLKGHDIILDGTDNFQSRFCINRAALLLETPLVSGALGRFDGQVISFPSNQRSSQDPGPCYQCLVPEDPGGQQSCAEVGIIGALAGIVGSMMALETIKLITGAGTGLSDIKGGPSKMWIFDGLSGETRIATLPRDPACPACQN